MWLVGARTQDYTYWSPRSSFLSLRPTTTTTNPVELAIASLAALAFEGLPPDVFATVAGAEWWAQRRTGSDGIGFHFDKDEGVASEHQWMKMPMFSTVTCVRACVRACERAMMR